MRVKIQKIVLALFISVMVIGCGTSSTKRTSHQNDENSEGSASYIPYLKQNHASYSQDGSYLPPAPVKNPNAKSIDWTINASSYKGAENLAKHIYFMKSKLENNKNPRAFDKLFLMEAYMKYHHYYTTSVEQSATFVVVSKQASTACAYEVISAHSDAVSKDFFAKGNIHNDYSAVADRILASHACDKERSAIEDYISSRQMGRR